MEGTLICNARLVNEGRIFEADLRIKDGRIDQIASGLSARAGEAVVDAQGKYLLPGMIDDQVHFREPGSPHKGSIATESRAAVAGGITSFMDMPNTNPPTLSLEALAQKEAIAARDSIANYAFHFGVSKDNFDVVEALDPRRVAGVKVFMGSSTGDMLVDEPTILERLFAHCPTILLTHCEDAPRIREREAQWKARFGEDIPADQHPLIRDAEACFKSSSLAVSLAKRFGTQLHVLHVTTARELELFEPGPIEGKAITAEVCLHHLLLEESSYADLGHRIKCNPAVKTLEDREALRAGLREGRLDLVGTDHAPHTWEEKQRSYGQAPSGLPLVQHALPALLELVEQGALDLTAAVEKSSHAVAKRFAIQDRGFLREGSWADLVLVEHLSEPRAAGEDPVLSRCGWTPLANQRFHHAIHATWVSGRKVWQEGRILEGEPGKALGFLR